MVTPSFVVLSQHYFRMCGTPSPRDQQEVLGKREEDITLPKYTRHRRVLFLIEGSNGNVGSLVQHKSSYTRFYNAFWNPSTDITVENEKRRRPYTYTTTQSVTWNTYSRCGPTVSSFYSSFPGLWYLDCIIGILRM